MRIGWRPSSGSRICARAAFRPSPSWNAVQTASRAGGPSGPALARLPIAAGLAPPTSRAFAPSLNQP